MKKRSASRPSARPAAPKSVKSRPSAGKKAAQPGPLIGVVTHYFAKIQVVVVKVTGQSLKIGDMISLVGKGDTVTQKVVSLQVESRDVPVARKGSLVGLKVIKPVGVGTKVFLRK